jgi:formylglycine-generating enzyme required for sulfatase activity
MTDRERLGLPDRYVPGRLDAAMVKALQLWRTASTETLLRAVQSRDVNLPDRIAVGNLLALAGDPRIDPVLPEMVDIPGGNVFIGLEESGIDDVLSRFTGLGLDRSWIAKECPRHRLALQPYRMARFPVTNLQYRTFLTETGYNELPSSWAFRQFPQAMGNHPVYTLSADAADAYVKWLSARTGRGFCLPTEAQWEWAAAGPEGSEFPWGNTFDAELLNTAECGILASTPVGVFKGGESPFGLEDMAGNVEEYVADTYAAYAGGEFVRDHLVAIHGSYRVARGGSFARFRDLARTRRRHGHNPRSATYAMGLRVAETI